MPGENPSRHPDLSARDDIGEEDLSEYPDWWRENIETFRAYSLQPYRPPRFTDGELTPKVIEEMESELDVQIRLRSVDPEEGDNWNLIVDGEVVTEVGRQREGEGYTQYKITSNEFVRLVRQAVR